MITQLLAHPILAWATTWLVHSTLLLGGVYLFERLRPHSAPRLREHLWRVAVFISLISASAVSFDFASYPAKRFEITQVEVMPADIDTEPAVAKRCVGQGDARRITFDSASRVAELGPLDRGARWKPLDATI